MEKNSARLTLYIRGLCVCIAAISLVHCDARKSAHSFRTQKHSRSWSIKFTRKMHDLKRFDTDKRHSFLDPILKQLVMPLDSSNSNPYISSPSSMPPYDSLAPIPLPDNSPPSTPLPPSTIPSPTGGYTPLPPPASSGPTLPGPNPPTTVPSPPSLVPNPPDYVPSPSYNVPTPTQPALSPPSGGYIPSPHIFFPPIVYPPPTVPPPPHTSSTTLWCVAKPSVPDPIIQEAMNYACGSGADCDQIQPSGPCFQPNTLFAHASYAFNSFWQRTKVAGGTCEFGGTSILVSIDPSYDECHFIYF
ncbi:unnamed protein product [Fraxinus pennsylvanica]|uniref:X8 domain-containing protein n=1 Tax=Fraxinus pennsylvanica TaxID=56036 RepID=A0AAD2AEV0_9LAMI|nr:unnamed protein product [Fraxinus pennsylvanica]